jgi:hypothetical protein
LTHPRWPEVIMRKQLRLLPAILLLLAATVGVRADVSDDLARFMHGQYANRRAVLRLGMVSSPFTADLQGGEGRLPAPVTSGLLPAGTRVTIRSVRHSGGEVTFDVTLPDGSRPAMVVFRLTPGAVVPKEEEALPGAVQAVFSLVARQGSADEPDEPDKVDAEPEPDQSESEEPEAPKEQQEEVRLLVESGKPALKGDGADTTTVTISARGEDGRILDRLQGPVAVRASAGALSAERVSLVNGRARVNLRAPMYGDEGSLLQKQLELTALIIQKIQGIADPAQARRVALETARQSGLSAVKADDPWVYIVADYQGVKGRAKVQVNPAPGSAGSIAGWYQGKDIAGAATWTLRPGPSYYILTQDKESGAMSVTFGEPLMGNWRRIYIYDAKEMESLQKLSGRTDIGMPSAVIPLTADSFYMFAPPILFYRTAPPEDAPPGQTTEPPKPTASLVALKNPIAADGESTTELVFTYLDKDQRPVAGLAVEWSLDRYGVFGPAEKGTLLRTEPFTNAAGEARALYRAPRMDAADMQQTGTVKNRDVTVSYKDAEGAGSVTGQIGLLKSAPVRLVVEKPGVERMTLPIQIGSLNGTLKGRILLQVVQYRPAGSPTRVPLQHAKVRLDGDEKILKWAAVDEAVTDEDGAFTLKMRMSNWERWDKEFKQPFLVRPSADFIARQFNCEKHLRGWVASPTVGQKGTDFIYQAQYELAELEPEEAEGLFGKLRLFGLMLMVCKDARSDGSVAAEELLGHAKDFLKGVAAYFYADSSLEKVVKEKMKLLGTKTRLRELQALLNRYLHQTTSRQTRVFKFLSDQFLDTWVQKNMLGIRAMLRKLAIPKLLGKLSEILAGWMPDLGLDFTKPAVRALLSPWDEAANADLEIFLDDHDYRTIGKNFIAADVTLSNTLGYMREDFLKVTSWRISDIWLKFFVDTTTECVSTVGKFYGLVTLNAALVEKMDKLDKIKEKLDTAASSIRFAVEVYRFVDTMEKAEQRVLKAIAASSGGRIQVSGLPAGLPGRTLGPVVQAGLLPGSGNPEVPKLELADALDLDAFEDPGRADEALAQTEASADILAGWQAEQLAGLIALGGADVDALDRYNRSRKALEEALATSRRLAIRRLAGEPDAGGRTEWETAGRRLRERVESFQDTLNDTRSAIAKLPPDPSALARQELASRRRGGLPWLRIALFGGAGLMLLLLILVPVLLVARGRHRRAAVAVGPASPAGPASRAGLPPQPIQALAAYPIPAPSPSPVPAPAPAPAAYPAPPPALAWTGPRLRDFTGAVHPLRADCTTVGAERDNLLVLGVPGISRHHARIWREADGRFWIEDLGSRNGTWVNGIRVDKAWLEPGAALALGGWSARFEV